MNPIQIISAMRSGNPKEVAINLIRQSNSNMSENAIAMIQRGDMQGLTELASNICQSNGTNLNDEINRIKSQYKM